MSLAVTAEASRPRRRWLGLSVVVMMGLLLAAVLGTGFGRDPRIVDSVLLDQLSPPLSGPTLDGNRFDLVDHRGKVVLVNVWASWCPPCRTEYPLLQQVQRELGPLGLQVVGINTQDTDSAALEFLDELGGATFPNVADPDGRLAVEWGTFGVPETFLVDRDGRAVTRQVGEVRSDWIDSTVLPLLERP